MGAVRRASSTAQAGMRTQVSSNRVPPASTRRARAVSSSIHTPVFSSISSAAVWIARACARPSTLSRGWKVGIGMPCMAPLFGGCRSWSDGLEKVGPGPSGTASGLPGNAKKQRRSAWPRSPRSPHRGRTGRHRSSRRRQRSPGPRRSSP